MRCFAPFLLGTLLLSASCKRTYVQRSQILRTSEPVTIIPDSSLFRKGGEWDDPASEVSFAYGDMLDLNDQSILLEEGKEMKRYIYAPTFLWWFRGGCHYLVYPGERIRISREQDETLTYTVEGNSKRTREMQFVKAVFGLQYEKPYTFDLPWNRFAAEQSLLQKEDAFKSLLPLRYGNRSKLIDSLARVYGVRKACRDGLRYQLRADSARAVFAFYRAHHDEYIRLHLYEKKARELTDVINQADRNSAPFYRETVSWMFDVICEDQKKKWLIRTDETLIWQYEMVKQHFRGAALDYLLARIMYRGLAIRLPAAVNLFADFVGQCHDPKLVMLIKAQYELYGRPSNKPPASSTNVLLDHHMKKKTLEDLLARHKGKVVLLDFWASWCAPCRAQMPFSHTLEQRYAGKDVVFLYMSLDRDIVQWKKASLTENMQPSFSFLFTDTHTAAFINSYHINTIPRYMLIGKEGAIVDADAPGPDEASLQKAIDAALQQVRVTQ